LERAWAILRTIRTMFMEEVKTNICQRDSYSSIATKWSTIASYIESKIIHNTLSSMNTWRKPFPLYLPASSLPSAVRFLVRFF
jgi:hypothetical protein